ncbi:MAG TPA: sugar ABC transporter substrate-binding protein [Spirochaetia bacterium]|nr:sugar ABC transporter substrate-binding protein [Spirochaetia bacterium]HRZ65581.1 sugar ABC transporter substrate-binding protein [Spirochaetia bacterium]
MRQLRALGIAALILAAIFPLQSQGKKTVLQYWSWDSSVKKQNEDIIAKFEAQNPGVKVELTTLETTEYWVKIRLLANQGKLPDVFNMSSGYLEEWARAGLVRDLGPSIDRDLDKKSFYMSVLDAGKDIAGTGKYCALPYALVTTVLYYNKDMFDKAGVAYPSASWTWEDFRKAAKKLTIVKDGKTQQYGFWFFGRYSNVESWVFANNGRLIDPATNSYKPDANAIEAMRFLTDLVLADKVAPAKKEMSAFRYQDVFPQGAAAMWVDGSWFIDNNRKIAGDKIRWDIAELPRGPKGDGKSVYGWPDYVSISPNTPNADLAWKFAKFVAGEGVSLDMYMAGKIPTYRPITESPAFLEKGQQPANKGLLIKQAAKAFRTSYTLGWSEWRGYGPAESLGLNGIIDAIIDGETSFDEGMNKADTNINKILKRYYK